MNSKQRQYYIDNAKPLDHDRCRMRSTQLNTQMRQLREDLKVSDLDDEAAAQVNEAISYLDRARRALHYAHITHEEQEQLDENLHTNLFMIEMEQGR